MFSTDVVFWVESEVSENLKTWPADRELNRPEIMCLQYAFLPVEAANIDRFFLPAELEKKTNLVKE